MRLIRYSPVIFILVLLDQLSKWAVTEKLFQSGGLGFFDWLAHAPEHLDFVLQPVLPFFNLVMVWNQGISFGLFNDHSDYGPLLLSALSLVVASGFGWWLCRVQDRLQIAGIVLVISGALGNVIDRFRFGAVIDFLDFHLSGYHWPAFNAADSFICVGVILLLVHSLFFEKTLQVNNGDTVE